MAINSNEPHLKKYALRYTASLIVVTLIFTPITITWLVCNFFNEGELQYLGQFGDMFGAVNALFSGLTIAFLIYTIILQRDEIKSQEKEKHFQRFESTFFQLLQLHNQNINSMEFIRRDNITKRGRDVFESYFLALQFSYEVWKTDYNDRSKATHLRLTQADLELVNSDIPIDEMKKLYNNIYEKYEPDLGHYFRILYHIFKFIDEAKIEEEEMIKYSKLVRAQLSKYELVFLFYDGLSEQGEKFKDNYIDKYQVLKNMSINSIFNKDHLKLYSHLATTKN